MSVYAVDEGTCFDPSITLSLPNGGGVDDDFVNPTVSAGVMDGVGKEGASTYADFEFTIIWHNKNDVMRARK